MCKDYIQKWRVNSDENGNESVCHAIREGQGWTTRIIYKKNESQIYPWNEIHLMHVVNNNFLTLMSF